MPFCNRTAESLTSLMPYVELPSRPPSLVYPTFELSSEQELPQNIHDEKATWIVSHTLKGHDAPSDDDNDEPPVPVWSAYNSLVNEALPVTHVGAPPLLAHPAHEWSMLLTVLMLAQNISVRVVGPGRKTVISLDLGLYLPAKRLQMAQCELKNILLQPGEPHVVRAMLRTIGSYIDSTGIDMCWIKSELYGPSTVKQIIDGKHVKHGKRAHMITLQALFSLYLEAFLKGSPDVHRILEGLSMKVGDACKKGTKENIQTAHHSSTNVIQSSEVVKKMSDFDAANATNPLFTVFRQYMCMVMELFAFIQAVHSGDWKLHLIALELFTKYFFVHDKVCYLRMIPLYLAEVASLESSDPEIYGEFTTGNWVVNKNKEVPFCAVGGDTALEHLNRSMKVSGGLEGNTLIESAQAKFFLIAPELARLTAEAKAMAGLVPERAHHRELNSAVLTDEDNSLNKLTETIKTFTNPFSSDQNTNTALYNLVTKVVMNEKTKKDLVNQSEEGRKLFSYFVQDRIKTGKINLWAPVKKRNLLTLKTSAKVIKVKAKDTIIELKENRKFARLAMVCKSRPEIDIQEAVGLYEFTVVPRSLFARDGTMLHCSCKSALMHILEKAGGPSTNTQEITAGFKVAIVDGMAEVQSLDKPEWIKNCRDLAEHFTNHLLVKYNDLQELHIIFDRYDVPSSLKSATRVKRQGGHAPIYYRITDSTHIAKVPMKKLLAHSKTKGELTMFLAKNVMDNANGYKSLWHGERNVRQRTETSGIYEVHKKKPTRRLFYMLWMPLLKVLPNYLYILLTLMFLFWLSDGIQICAPTLALLLEPAVVVELST